MQPLSTSRPKSNTTINVNGKLPRTKIGGWSIFRLIIVILLAITVARTLIAPNSGHVITFQGFLQTLVDCPKIDFSQILSLGNFTIQGDWGLLNVIKSFLESIVSLFSILLYLVGCVIQLFTFVLYFLRYVFVG